MADQSILVLDVGGSHISAAVFDFEAAPDAGLGQVGHVPVPAGCSAAEFLDTAEALCRQMLPLPAPVEGLAVAMPSPFDYQRGISYMKHKFPCLYGIDLREALAEGLGCEPGSIHFVNDAAAYLVGELHQGAGVGVERVVGITLGTGIGSAFAVGRNVVVEGQGVPEGGEIWNLPYRGGIVEDWAGTAAIQRLYAEEADRPSEDREGVRQIAADAAAGDAIALKTFERFGRELGLLLRFSTAAFNPQRIVVGGGIAQSAGLFFPAAQAELDELSIELRAAVLSDRAPLIGAAMSWKQSRNV